MSRPSPRAPRPARRRRARSAVLGIAVLTLFPLTSFQAASSAAESPQPTGGNVAAEMSADQHAALVGEATDAAPEIAKALKLDPNESLFVSDVVKDKDGTTHLRYNRGYAGLPVLGGDLVVHRTAQGALSDTRAAVSSISVPSTTPRIPALQAQNLTKAQTPPRLVVWAAAGTPALAWESVVGGTQHDGTPSEQHVITDATSGKKLYEYEAVRTGAGQGQYNGAVTIGTNPGFFLYEMDDVRRGGHRTYNAGHSYSEDQGSLFVNWTDNWGSGSQDNDQTAAVDVHYGAGMTWDYYKNVHGRSGIRGDGVGAYSRVHYGDNYKNAFWNNTCFCMTYGDGANNAKPLTELNVAAHEMSHGLTFATAGLQYKAESGGLNEATSDIFGAAVSFYANNAKDRPSYLIGKGIDLFGNGNPLRYMDEPSKDHFSPDYWYSGIGAVDVHFSSGPANHFFYLLSEGSGQKTINGYTYNSPTYDGKPVPGIGRTNAEKIWYRALTTYMTSTTDYAGARQATLQAAADIFGAGSAAYNTVGATWRAVNVNA